MVKKVKKKKLTAQDAAREIRMQPGRASRRKMTFREMQDRVRQAENEFYNSLDDHEVHVKEHVDMHARIKEADAVYWAKKKANDPINHPSHYTQGIECADYVESQGMDFFQGNAVKYLTRFKHKGTPLQDLEKAKWYVERLIQIQKKKPHQWDGKRR